MPLTRTCPECGGEIAAGAAEGLCPACLLRHGADQTLAGAPTAQRAEPAARRVRYFGDYELLHPVAEGGMGIVYKARQVSLNRTVAVKMIRAGQFASDNEVRRFHTEAEAAANLQHPNIVAIHEVGEHDGQHYFSMDFIAGQNLAQLAEGKPLPAER